MQIIKYGLGGSVQVAVALPGYPAVTVARADERLSTEELKARAIAYWNLETQKKQATEILRGKYPSSQVFVGYLPAPDIETSLEGLFAYVLKPRRRRGKYQILEAMPIKDCESMKR